MMKPGIKSVFKKNLQSSILTTDILLALMMACVTYGALQMAKAAFSTWNIYNLLWVSMIITIEALYSRRIAKVIGGTEEIIYRVSELVVIALVIKLMLYIFKGGFFVLLADIPKWQESFVNFFDADYLLTLVFLFIIWFLSTILSNNLDKLHNLDENITWDTLSIFQKDFQATHSALLLQVMGIGLVVLLMAIFTRLTVDFGDQIHLQYKSSNAPVINVLAYFFLSLILLSQSQLATLRTRWWLDKVKISTKLSSNWLLSAVIFFAFLTVVAFILPTDYSVGLLDTLRTILNFILSIGRFILSLILLPFYLLATLLGAPQTSTTQPTEAPITPLATPVPQETTVVPDWWQVLKSFLFWAILIFIVGYAIWQYLQRNEQILEFLSKFKLIKWLRETWKKFREWLSGVNQNVSTFIRERIEGLRSSATKAAATRKTRRINFRKLSPQHKIIYLYQEFTNSGSRHGIIRKIFHTPFQYAENIETVLPNITNDVDSLTDVFIHARYSGKPMDENQVRIVMEDVRRINKEIHQKEKSKETSDSRPETN